METKLIKKGMENVEKGTCVRFVPWTHQRDYVDIQPKSGWDSLLGKFDPSSFCFENVLRGRDVKMLQILSSWHWIITSHELSCSPVQHWIHPQSPSNAVCCVCVCVFIQLLVLPWCTRWKTDRVPPESRLPPCRSHLPWIHACPGLCARAIALRPGQLCHHQVAKYLEG